MVEGVYRCHGNAENFAVQAEVLFTAGCFAGCVNACRLAVEELAKSHLLTLAASFKETETEKWRWLWAAFTDHREKLRVIEYEVHWPAYQDTGTFHDRVTALRNLREDAVYVQFDAAKLTFQDPQEALTAYGGAEVEARRQSGYLGLLMLCFFPVGRPSKSELFAGFRQIQTLFEKPPRSRGRRRAQRRRSNTVT